MLMPVLLLAPNENPVNGAVVDRAGGGAVEAAPVEAPAAEGTWDSAGVGVGVDRGGGWVPKNTVDDDDDEEVAVVVVVVVVVDLVVLAAVAVSLALAAVESSPCPCASPGPGPGPPVVVLSTNS